MVTPSAVGLDRFALLVTATPMAMSGPRRLAIFLTGVWVIGGAILYSIDPYPEWNGYLVVAVAPACLAWNAWWVWRGFRPA